MWVSMPFANIEDGLSSQGTTGVQVWSTSSGVVAFLLENSALEYNNGCYGTQAQQC